MFPNSILNKKFLQFIVGLIFFTSLGVSLYLSNELSKSSESQKINNYRANYNFLINQKLNQIEDQISFISSKEQKFKKIKEFDFIELNIELIYSRIEKESLYNDVIIWQQNTLNDPYLSQVFINSSNTLIEASKRFLGKPLYGSLIHFPDKKNVPIVFTVKNKANTFETIVMWLDVDAFIIDLNKEFKTRFTFLNEIEIEVVENIENSFAVDRIPSLNFLIQSFGKKDYVIIFGKKIYYNTIIVALLNMVIATLLLILISQTFSRFTSDNFKYLSFWNQEIKDKLLSVREISSSIAHELNQPLAAAEIFVSTMQIELKKEKINIKEILSISESISQQVSRSSKIIKSMSSLSKNKAAEILPYQVSSLFSEILPLIKLQAKEYESHVNIDIEQNHSILVDKVAFEQIVLNISRNAFQSMSKKNKPQRILNIATSLTKSSKSLFSGDKISIIFSDNGVGINKNITASKLFEPFYSENKDGAGLGLNIVKSLVEQNKGRISFANNEKGGCDFTIELPLLKNEEHL
jgi:signal transduction histidine kinase